MSASEETPVDEHRNRILNVRGVMQQREKARAVNDFVKSDMYRENLKSLGVEVIDQKGGPSGWKFIDGSSNKLKAGSNKIPEGTERRARPTDEVHESNKKRKSEVSTTGNKQTKAAQKEPVKKAAKAESNSVEADRMKKMALAVTGPVRVDVQNVQGVKIETIKTGEGRVAEAGKRVKVMYVGKLKTNGRVFDASKKPFAFKLGRSEVIRGWDIGVAGMKIGEKRVLTIPPEKAYGKAGAPPTIPSNATLVFDVTLLEVI